ncbi:MAG: hypothetical protein PHG66_04460 [Candidatus Colwellbacteria bacterium]|nr:hypothetical protein [Candidatus Colwellbacteria bacterium]
MTEVIKNFQSYELDSNETIADRIAVSKKTLPDYIKVMYGETKNITTLNLIDQIKKFKPHELEKFYETYKEDFPKVDFDNFARLWYLYALKEGDKSIMDPHVQITLDAYLEKQSSNFSKIEGSMGTFKTDMKTKLDSLTKKVSKDLADFKEFSTHSKIHSTPIEVVRVKTELVFEVEYDIYELFNYMKMSRDIPFAVIGSYYKIMEGFVPSDRWSYARERLEGDFGDKRDVLYLKTLNVKNEPLKNYERIDPNLYSTVSIYFETPQEESRRKRDTRLRDEETKDKEKKRLDKKRREEEREERKKEDDVRTIRRKKKDGTVTKSADEIKREREDATKEKQRLRKEREKLEIEERERRKEDDEIKISDLENEIVRTSKVYMRLESPINPDLKEIDLITRILNSFPSKIHIQSKRQVQIKAEFLIPNFYLDRPVFLDSVMNDRLFYQRCFVDERMRIQKEKGGVYLYFAFSPSDTDDKFVACSMTEQVVEKTNLKIISKDPDLKTDTPYLRVRITRVPDEETAEKFKSIFTGLISLYITRKDDIIEKYNKYMPDFSDTLTDLKSDIEKKRKKSTRTRKMLKDVDPDQFISGYSRWLCPTKRAPRIVGVKDPNDDEEPQEIKDMQDEKGIQVLLFPKLPEEDGQKYNQYYYACDHHGTTESGKTVKNPTIYPALRINALGNSEKYPIVPCCYAKDHRSKGKNKSILRMYYEEGKTFADFRDKKKGDEDEDEKHIFTTNKIVPLKRFGVLIKDVDNYFKSIDNSNIYYRQGVTHSFNSIIEVMLMATEGKKFELYTKEERLSRVLEVRREMVDMVKSSDIYQQTVVYSRNPESIESYLNDKNKYMDPKMFTRLIEDYFKCYLFIFSQNDQYPFGVLSSPHHLKEYLSYRKKEKDEKDKKRKGKEEYYPTVFIYEHMGSELDRAEYPQCELIVRISNNGEKQAVFENNFAIVKRTQEIFDEMYFSNPIDKDIIISFDTPLDGQGIDFYGKTRFLSFADGVCILTDPLPPLEIPVLYKYKTIVKKQAIKFMNHESAANIKNHVVSGKLVGFHATKGHIKFYIPIVPERTDLENGVDIISPSFISEKSELSLYNEFHRIARYLTEYTLYLFSLYHRDRPPKGDIDADYIIGFAKRNIEIDENFVYGKVPRIFSLVTGVLRDRKLIVPNETVLKKLIYTLRIRLRNNKEEIKNYSEYKYIQRYYADIKDFDQLDSQLIIYGQHALIKWIENVKQIYPLHDSVQHTGVSLVSELSKYDTSKPFIVVFTSSWHKASKNLINRIVIPKKARKGKIDRRDLMTEYGHKFNFVYIDIDNNRGITSAYNVDSIPYIYFFRIQDGKSIELGKIKGGDNTNENIKLIKKNIEDILG